MPCAPRPVIREGILNIDATTDTCETAYLKWLTVISLLSSVAGWIMQGVLSDGFVYWALPLIWNGTTFFTMNGDTVIESIILLVILGIIALVCAGSDAVHTIVGTGTITGAYVALVLSKISFALVKDDAFGSRGF